MLISIAGVQGIGKSTLIDAMKRTYNIRTIERKTSRSILTDWGVSLSEVNNDPDLTKRFQDEIVKRKLEDESVAASDPTSVYVTERTYADLMVYAVMALGKDNPHSAWLDKYYTVCLDAQRTYTHAFYLTGQGRLSSTVVDDGVRSINMHYSSVVDLAMVKFTSQMCAYYGIPFRPIDCGLVSERLQVLEEHLPVLKELRR